MGATIINQSKVLEIKTKTMNHLKFLLFALAMISLSCSQESDSPPLSGTNSSYSSLLTLGDFMYQVNSTSIVTFDISNPAEPKEIDKQIVGFDIESISSFGGVLFIGSGEALHIFEVGNDGIPERRSQTNYSEFEEDQTPCDPVVSDGKHAFVTLSTSLFLEEGPCNRAEPVNELRIYNVTDITKPEEVNRVEMNGPKGLAVDGDFLFVCDGVIGKGELRQYDYSDITQMALLSTLDL